MERSCVFGLVNVIILLGIRVVFSNCVVFKRHYNSSIIFTCVNSFFDL